MDYDLDLKELANPPVAEAPWYFRLGKFLSKHHIRGGFRLIAEARRRGLLDQLAPYSVGDMRLLVPLWRPCNAWLEKDILDYEAALVRLMANTAYQFTGGVTLVDCGADIGTLSVHMVARCKKIERVIAFEPNPAAHRVLAQNLADLPVPAEAHHAAVSSFCGRGRLVHSPEDRSAHAMYVAPADDGPIAVRRIDDLGIDDGRPCIIKIDVEGSEGAVIEGGRRTIQNAREVVVSFEAHPRIARRSGRDPIEIVQQLLAIRDDFAFDVDTMPARSIAPDRPLFDQVPPTIVYNVIARTS